MTEDRLRELEALCEQATPGPWMREHGIIWGDSGRVKVAYSGALTHDVPTLDFIAAVRTAIPELIAALRESQKLAYVPGRWECPKCSWDSKKVSGETDYRNSADFFAGWDAHAQNWAPAINDNTELRAIADAAIQRAEAAEAEVERLRARTHEMQERYSKELAAEKHHTAYWDDLRQRVDDVLREPGVAYQSASVRAAAANLLERAEAAETQVLALRRIAIPNHTGHWDPTGGSGSGCPECQRIMAALADTKAVAEAIEERIEQRGYDRAKAEDRTIIAQGIALSKAQP